jgi:hypothetical protein
MRIVNVDPVCGAVRCEDPGMQKEPTKKGKSKEM